MKKNVLVAQMRRTYTSAILRGLQLAIFSLAATAGFCAKEVGITELFISPSPVEVGKETRLQFTVTNLGDTNIDDLHVTATIPQGSIVVGSGFAGFGDSTISGNQYCYDISFLLPNSSAIASIDILAPFTTGTIEFPVVLECETPDTTPDNNTSNTSAQVIDTTFSGPDLAFAWSSKVNQQPKVKCKTTAAGSVCKISTKVIVTNVGSVATPSTGTLEFWLSEDETLSTNDPGLGDVRLKSLRPGQSKIVKFKSKYSGNISGQRLVTVCRDPDSAPADNRLIWTPFP